VSVRVVGELDVDSVPELEAALAEGSAHGGALVLDFSELAFIDSTGIGLLLVAWQDAQRDGYGLRFTRATDTVMRAIARVGLLDQLPFGES
jgi:anti-sigma B factor antagonist